MAALAAHGKSNGLGGHKLSRYAGWWAFEHFDTGKGFDAGYKLWNSAATATSHLFFAYLRSSTPEPGSTNGILDLPRSLQQLLDSVDYPPPSTLIANDTTKVVMIVDVVSPTPFALLRRTKQFEYRDDDFALQRFAEFQDPVEALTEECRRVLRAISSANQSHISDAKTSTSLKDPSWSRFEDIGFGSAFDEAAEDNTYVKSRSMTPQGLSITSRSPTTDLNRPTTPSWADFLSSGFADENGNKAPAPILLPPDKALPPMGIMPRGQSSQSHRRDLDMTLLEPGELASITKVELDDSFWWVWISSLAGEEPVARKAAFGRCALIETKLMGGQWMVIEEQVKGAAPEPAPGAYVAERKSFFSFTKKGRLTRRRSALKKSTLADEPKPYDPSNRLTLDQERQAKIQKAAAELAEKKKLEEAHIDGQRRGRADENANAKTSSIFTLGPLIKDEASPALQWAKQYDKKAVRQQYLGDDFAGKGSTDYLLVPSGSGLSIRRSTSTLSISNKELPPPPKEPARTEDKPISAHSAIPRQVEEPVREPVREPVVVAEPQKTHSPPNTAPSSAPAVQSPRLDAQDTANIPVETPSVTDLTKIVSSKQSSESKRSRRSDKDKPVTERSRLKKLGFNAPPPVAANKNGGMKKFFGTLRKRDQSNNHLMPDSPTHEDPAIAAARRALEGKPAKPDDGPVSPPLSPNHFARMHNVAANKASEPAAPVSEPVPESNHIPEPESEPMPVEPVHEEPVIKSSVYALVTQAHAPVAVHRPEPIPEVVTPYETPYEHLPQRPHRVDEFEDLSQVDSHEKARAQHEFSQFDQGPLTDQPAFAPSDKIHDTDSESDVAPAFEPPHRPQHQSVYSNVTMQTDATDEEPQPDPYTSMAAHDRWAQIRKNAAERAARATEDQGRSRTGTRTTDDGETSGEESELLVTPVA